MRTIFFLTDFGRGEYGGLMEANLRRNGFTGHCVTITHYIAPQQIREAAFILEHALDYLPEDALIISVVDPGVGTKRRIILASMDSLWILAPDNGILTPIIHQLNAVWNIPYTELFPNACKTFHGRDIFAPCAAFIATQPQTGFAFESINQEMLTTIADYFPTQSNHLVEGTVVHIDHFGNCITNICIDKYPGVQTVTLEQNLTFRHLHSHYAEAKPGTPIALVSSYRTIELAIVEGNYAQNYNIKIGHKVKITIE